MNLIVIQDHQYNQDTTKSTQQMENVQIYELNVQNNKKNF